jgi:DNA polymerase-1
MPASTKAKAKAAPATVNPAARPLKKGDHLFLVDGSGYIFRAYHALPPLSRKSDGLPTGAVSGYCNMMWKLLEDMKGWEKPTHLAVIFDAGQRTFRNEIYAEYKANRVAMADDLSLPGGTYTAADCESRSESRSCDYWGVAARGNGDSRTA